MNDKEKIKFLTETINIIMVYCDRVEVSEYTDEELELLKSEFEPIIDECRQAIEAISYE